MARNRLDWQIGLWVGNSEIFTEQHESRLLFYFISLFILNMKATHGPHRLSAE